MKHLVNVDEKRAWQIVSFGRLPFYNAPRSLKVSIIASSTPSFNHPTDSHPFTPKHALSPLPPNPQNSIHPKTILFPQSQGIYFFAPLSGSGSPVLGLIFSTRQTLLSSCWFLIACPLSRALISFAEALAFCASWAWVILNPSSPRRRLMASDTLVSVF